MRCATGTAYGASCSTESLKIQHQTSARWPVSNSGTAPSTIWHSDGHDAGHAGTAIRVDALEGEVGSHCKPSRNGGIDLRRQPCECCVGLVLVGDDTSWPRDVYIGCADEEGPTALELRIALDVACAELVDRSVDNVAVDDGVSCKLEPAHIPFSVALVADPHGPYALPTGDYGAGFQLSV